MAKAKENTGSVADLLGGEPAKSGDPVVVTKAEDTMGNAPAPDNGPPQTDQSRGPGSPDVAPSAPTGVAPAGAPNSNDGPANAFAPFNDGGERPVAPQEMNPRHPHTSAASEDPLQRRLIEQRSERPTALDDVRRPEVTVDSIGGPDVARAVRHAAIQPVQPGLGETQPGVPAPGAAEAVMDAPREEDAPQFEPYIHGGTNLLHVDAQHAVNVDRIVRIDKQSVTHGGAMTIVTDAGEVVVPSMHREKVSELLGYDQQPK